MFDFVPGSQGFGRKRIAELNTKGRSTKSKTGVHSDQGLIFIEVSTS